MIDIRHEIERLATWYIPLAIVSALSSNFLSKFLSALPSEVQVNAGIGNELIYLVLTLFSISTHFVIGYWLYSINKKLNGRYYLWLLFGVFGHIFAVIMFLFVYFFEHQKAFNKSL